MHIIHWNTLKKFGHESCDAKLYHLRRFSRLSRSPTMWGFRKDGYEWFFKVKKLVYINNATILLIGETARMRYITIFAIIVSCIRNGACGLFSYFHVREIRKYLWMLRFEEINVNGRFRVIFHLSFPCPATGRNRDFIADSRLRVVFHAM